MSRSSEPFGTITPLNGMHKMGLSITGELTINPVQKSSVAKWTVQCVDNQKDYYRLYVNDDEKSYALRTSEKGTGIHAFEAAPSSMTSHVWYIPRLSGDFFGIIDPVTIRAWKVNGTTVDLVDPPVVDEALEAFKFKFSFAG